jgi:hypothetical protein
MMPTFPWSPLKFRTVGFPQYGFKAGISDGPSCDREFLAAYSLHPSFVHPAACNAASSF